MMSQTTLLSAFESGLARPISNRLPAQTYPKYSMETLTEASDEELVEQSLAGDSRAYDEIVRRYQQSVANALYRFSFQQADLEDLVQDTFIRAYKKLDLWTPKASLGAWLRTIGFRLSYDYLRKQKRNPLALRKAKFPDQEDHRESEDALIVDHRDDDALECNRDLVKWLLSKLKTDEAMILTYLHLDQLSVEEIADRTEWTSSNIKVKAHRARKKLGNYLKEYNGDGTSIFQIA